MEHIEFPLNRTGLKRVLRRAVQMKWNIIYNVCLFRLSDKIILFKSCYERVNDFHLTRILN